MAVVFVCRWRAPGRGRRRQGAIPETAEAEARRAKAEERVENFILVVIARKVLGLVKLVWRLSAWEKS